MQDIVNDRLDIVCEAIGILRIACDDVELGEADARLRRQIEQDTVFFAEQDPFEDRRIECFVIIDILKTDDLHMRMADRTARERTVVLEEQHRLIFARLFHRKPMAESEAKHMMQMLWRVDRQLRHTFIRLYEDCLKCILQYGIFIFDKHKRAFVVDDVRQLAAVAERTFRSRIDNALGLLATNGHIEFKMRNSHSDTFFAKGIFYFLL